MKTKKIILIFLILFFFPFFLFAKSSVIGISPNQIVEDIPLGENADVYFIFSRSDNTSEETFYLSVDDPKLQLLEGKEITLKIGENQKKIPFRIKSRTLKAGSYESNLIVSYSSPNAPKNGKINVRIQLNGNVKYNVIDKSTIPMIDINEDPKYNNYLELLQVVTDKEEYNFNENISINISIKNNSDFLITNIPYSIKILDKDEQLYSYDGIHSAEILPGLKNDINHIPSFSTQFNRNKNLSLIIKIADKSYLKLIKIKSPNSGFDKRIVYKIMFISLIILSVVTTISIVLVVGEYFKIHLKKKKFLGEKKILKKKSLKIKKINKKTKKK